MLAKYDLIELIEKLPFSPNEKDPSINVAG